MRCAIACPAACQRRSRPSVRLLALLDPFNSSLLPDGRIEVFAHAVRPRITCKAWPFDLAAEQPHDNVRVLTRLPWFRPGGQLTLSRRSFLSRVSGNTALCSVRRILVT